MNATRWMLLLAIPLVLAAAIWFTTSVVHRRTYLEELLDQLNNPNDPARQATLQELSKGTAIELTDDQKLFLLDIADRYNSDDPNVFRSDSGTIVSILEKADAPAIIDKLKAKFPSYDANARFWSLRILAAADNVEAASTFVELARQHYSGKGLPSLTTIPLRQKPKFAEVYFPNLLAYDADGGVLTDDIFETALAYIDDNSLSDDQRKAVISAALNRIRISMKYFERWSSDTTSPVKRPDEYKEIRYRTTLLLDILGHDGTPETAQILDWFAGFPDHLLQSWAIISMATRRLPVNESIVAAVCLDYETRKTIYLGLKRADRLGLFPSDYLNQKFFAEGNMADWLVYPTELDAPPDEIELMETKTTADGTYYLFRFRTFPPHWAAPDGWMAGLAGPYPLDGRLAISGKDTFSKFEKWESKTPDQHLQSILQVTRRTAANRNGLP